MIKRKIAIIGGGVAGLTAAWQLAKKYDVTLFEKERAFGGHAETVHVETPSGPVPADLAVQLFSDQVYPNLFAHFATYGIQTYLSPVSFASHFPKPQDYWSNFGIPSIRMGKELKVECDRFQKEMAFLRNVLPEQISSMVLGEFLLKEKFSQAFIQKALKPIFSILAGTRASFTEFSLLYSMVLFNTGLLSFFSPPQWRRLKNGISSHIDILRKEAEKYGMLCSNSEVVSVNRNTNNVEVCLQKNKKLIVDQVVFATSAATTLKLIRNPTLEERKLFSKFEYHEVTSVLHTDAKFLDFVSYSYNNTQDYADLPSCIYSIDQLNLSHCEMGSTTFVVNSYTNTRKIPFPILVSIDPKKPICQKSILATRSYKLPKLRPSDLVVKKAIGSIQGMNNTWFCGLDSSNTGHESSFLSGLVVSEALGCEYPYGEFLLAKSFFENAKQAMGMDINKKLQLTK